MKITSRIEKFEGNNVHLKGKVKPFFVPSEDLKPAMANHPIGMVVTIEVDKGTVKKMTPATAAEASSYAQDEKAAEAMKAATPAKKPAGFETGKEILERNLKEKVASVAHSDAACAQISKEEQADKLMKECKNLPERCEFVGCAIPGNMPLCLKEWVKGSSYRPVCEHAGIGAGLTTTIPPAAKTAEKQAQIDSTGVYTAPATNPPKAPQERKKGPAEERRMPTEDELLDMVYNYDTYWKGKTLMDIAARKDIRHQVQTKNWQEAVNSAIEYHQRCEDGLSTAEDLTNCVFPTAELIHDFIQRHVSGSEQV